MEAEAQLEEWVNGIVEASAQLLQLMSDFRDQFEQAVIELDPACYAFIEQWLDDRATVSDGR
jgi:hypothetical protein